IPQPGIGSVVLKHPPSTPPNGQVITVDMQGSVETPQPGMGKVVVKQPPSTPNGQVNPVDAQGSTEVDDVGGGVVVGLSLVVLDETDVNGQPSIEIVDVSFSMVLFFLFCFCLWLLLG